MRTKKRVTFRFYVFCILFVVCIWFIIYEVTPTDTAVSLVQGANATYSYTVDAIIIRDEEVGNFEGSGMIVYLAEESQEVGLGDEICEVYSSAYAETELERLETVRQNIRSYHEELLSTLNNEELDQLSAKIVNLATQMKRLIANKENGSLLQLEMQLEESMTERQEYLRRNQRSDYRLTDLYDQEAKRENALSSWKVLKTADRDGIVSFYLDGYEQFLTPDSVTGMTINQFHDIQSGHYLASKSTSRLVTNVYRIVDANKWYIVMLSSDATWNPSAGQSFIFQMKGYVENEHKGTVVAVQKTSSNVMAVMEVEESPADVMNVRMGKADISAYMTGLSVPIRAIRTEGGQTGVMIMEDDNLTSTFVPVNVLSQDSHNALIMPVTEGMLSVGQKVVLN